MSDLTHFDDNGQAHMVDVSKKPQTHREAVAQASISMNASAFQAVQNGTSKKGDVLGVARIAGVQAAKKTSDLIPLCHPLMITKVSVEFQTIEENQKVTVQATVKTMGQTGVEMEALTAASAAALTIYDMLKAVDKKMVISDIAVLEKKGGRSGHYVAPDDFL